MTTIHGWCEVIFIYIWTETETLRLYIHFEKYITTLDVTEVTLCLCFSFIIPLYGGVTFSGGTAGIEWDEVWLLPATDVPRSHSVPFNFPRQAASSGKYCGGLIVYNKEHKPSEVNLKHQEHYCQG